MVGRIHFGKYRVIKEIGKGGMSNVFLAENIKLGNKWAIKRIKKSGSPINLLAEPSILKDLNHPLIPQIVDIEEDTDYLYIIEEYVEGINLQEYKNQNKDINESIIIDFAIQMCDVLEYLHTRKPYPIIYRDMKPGNIMLTEGNKIKFVDFGIAREYKYNSNTDTVLIGTMGYAAPEQFGLRQSDVRTDIYSFGVTLYYLISGNNISLNYKELSLKEYGNYSDTLENLIERCIRIQPEERYQSVIEIKEELMQKKDTERSQVHTVYSVVKQKTIGVMSLTNRAGATFFTTNLAAALGKKNVLISIIELPYDNPYIYDLVGISNYSEVTYYSILNEINNNKTIQRDKITTINNIMYLVRDPTRGKIDNWDDNKTMKLIYSAKESLISIVDIGYNYENIENLLPEFDLIYVLYDAMPPDLMANYNKLEKLEAYNKKNNNIRYVLNSNNTGINMKTLNNYLEIRPDVTIPRLSAELMYRCAYKKKFPYEEKKLKNIFDEKFQSIYRELLPKELNGKKHRRKLFG
ncbi:hypothetical protein AN1V17_15190 [Vallitalea sediminicola]